MSNAISPSTQNELSENIPSTQPNGFSHLYVFSIEGLVVLFLLWMGLAAGPLWFPVFALFMYGLGWISLPLSIQTLPYKEIILYFILFEVAIYILGFALKFLINWTDRDNGDMVKACITFFSIDLILIVTILWVVVNGVFVYTSSIGRWSVLISLICLTITGRIPIKFTSKIMPLLISVADMAGCSVGCLPLLRPLYVFLSLCVISIWL